MRKIVSDAAAREDASHPDLYCSFSLSIGLQKVDLNKADPPMRHKMHPGLPQRITSRFQISFLIRSVDDVTVVPDSKWLANGLMWMLRDSTLPKW